MADLPEGLDAVLPNGLSDLLPYFSPPRVDADRDTRIWSGNGKRSEDWLTEYDKSARSASFGHDEPWLTLMALFGLLHDQTDLASRVGALNDVMKSAYAGPRNRPTPPIFSKLVGAHVEVYLRENVPFRHFLTRSVFQGGPYHPYADRCQTLREKLSREAASLEGNTNVDALLSGYDETGDRMRHVFIEAKFLSDISTSITYLPVRNQIARNIDCVMEVMTSIDGEGKRNWTSLDDFWFILLTPGMFRTEAYGGSVCTPIEALVPSRSRLYCYKMNDYLQPGLLKQDLPHRNELADQQWSQVSSRVGWLTYESIVDCVKSRSLLSGEALEAWTRFFANRALTVDAQ
jgi:hypothetical protein